MLAVLIQCHKNPSQINMMFDSMQNPEITFFVHVDKKSDIKDEIVNREDVVILPDESRVDVQWAGISQIDATLNLMRFARAYDDFDYFWLCSGQDFPIKPPEEIVAWLSDHPGCDFVELFNSKNNGADHENFYDKRTSVFFPCWMLGNSMFKRVCKRAYTELTGGYNKTFKWARRKHVNGLKFYFGSQWICVSGRTMDWLMDYLEGHPEYYRFYENSSCPDESFFQTLIMNSPFASNRMDYLHYVDWSEGKRNPKILKTEDYKRLICSGKLMARKFDNTVDAGIIEKLRLRISEKHFTSEG